MNDPKMKVHTLRDYTGCESTHLAIDFEAAVQAHLMHYGLCGLNGDIEEIDCKELSEIEDRNTICWDLNCCLVAATDLS